MGSKNLKGVAVMGSGSVTVDNPEAFIQLSQSSYREAITEEDNQWVIEEGTAFLVELTYESGLPVPFQFSSGVHVVPETLPFTYETPSW